MQCYRIGGVFLILKGPSVTRDFFDCEAETTFRKKSKIDAENKRHNRLKTLVKTWREWHRWKTF
jgi:hypothetical protein